MENLDIYNIIDKMIPERKLIYDMEVDKLKNIISTERLKCVINTDKYYVTVSLPQNTDEEQVTFKCLNNTKIESKLKKSTQFFVDAIKNYCNNGSGYKLSSIMGTYCNINKFSPLRGGSYIDLPQYFKDKNVL